MILSRLSWFALASVMVGGLGCNVKGGGLAEPGGEGGSDDLGAGGAGANVNGGGAPGGGNSSAGKSGNGSGGSQGMSGRVGSSGGGSGTSGGAGASGMAGAGGAGGSSSGSAGSTGSGGKAGAAGGGGGGGNPGTGGSVMDAGVLDARPIDAPPLTPTPGVVQCGPMNACNLATTYCCQTRATGPHCFPSNAGCDGTPRRCDGPEDCDTADGEICCAFPAEGNIPGYRSQCAKARDCLSKGYFPTCRVRQECPAGVTNCCPMSIGGVGLTACRMQACP
jgi:hypothetical protein